MVAYCCVESLSDSLPLSLEPVIDREHSRSPVLIAPDSQALPWLLVRYAGAVVHGVYEVKVQYLAATVTN